jgi:hypothetical protein
LLWHYQSRRAAVGEAAARPSVCNLPLTGRPKNEEAMAKILDLTERLQAKLSKVESNAVAFKRTSQRQRVLVAAVMAALEAGSSRKEIARTLRFIADELEGKPR